MSSPASVGRSGGLMICIILSALISVILVGRAAQAASAVAINAHNNQYTWHAAGDVAHAKQTALDQCAKRSGGQCVIFLACGLPGQGAIAFNRTSGHWGAACGAGNVDRTREFAVDNCNNRSGGKGRCEIVDGYKDDHPGGDPATGYFSGRWAENCTAQTWRQFRVVNAQEFRMLDCNASQCTDRREVFRPLFSETVFHWPTNNTRIRKRGPNNIEITHVNAA